MTSGSSASSPASARFSMKGKLGLRARIVLLGLILIVPMLLLALVSARHSADLALEQARDRAQLLVREENLNYDDLIQQSKVILDFVSHAPITENAAECSPYLAATKARYPWLSGLFILNPDGTNRCASLVVPAGVNVTDRDYFKRAMATKQLAISNFLISKITQKPVITVALPVVNQAGEVERIVGAGISVQSLNELIAADNLRRGTGSEVSTTIIDGEGTIVARYPAIENCIGQKVADQQFAQEILRRKEGEADMPGLTGADSILAFQPFASTPSFIAVGIAKQPILAAINHQTHRTIGIMLGVILLTVIVGLFGSEMLILRPQHQLAELAQKIGGGEYDVETAPASTPEVRELQTSFTGMAARLKEREAALRASREEIYRINRNLLLAEQVAHVGHWRLDLAHDHLDWSEEMYRIHGVDPASFVPTLANSLDAYHPDDRATVQRLVDWAIGFTRDFDFTLRIVRPSGEIRHVMSRGFCELNEAGNVISIFGVFADITILKEAEARLKSAQLTAEAANDAKSTFLSTVSHELRQPLTSIIGFADLLLERAGDDAEMRRFLELQRGSGEHLLTLINDLLDHSKIEAGMVEIEQRPISLDELLDQCHALLDENARRKQVALSLDIMPSLPMVLGDSARLQQILLNLGGNALKFTPAGQITLRCRLTGTDDQFSRIRFEVEDSGIGIPADRITHLFQRFRQADSTITRRFGGTGLGLTIAKELVEAMHGEMGVASVEGQGSTFWFEIPFRRATGEKAAQPTVLEHALHRTSLDPLHILLAEDSPINQALFSEILHDMGHHVTVVNNGDQALRIIEEDEAIDLVLMDLEMPELDGLGATHILRHRGCTLPIIGLTGHATDAAAALCTAAGMTGQLVKPIDIDELYDMIERYRVEVKDQEEV